MKPFAAFDWTGDGKIDSWDDAYELSMIVQSVEEQEREDRIRTLTDAIVHSGLSQVGNAEFDELCRRNGIRMADFQQSDIDEIQRRLNRY